MGGTVLNTTVKEKDLGLTIRADMKVSEQCGIAAAKGNQILGLIRRNMAATICSADGLWPVTPTFSCFFMFIPRFHMVLT